MPSKRDNKSYPDVRMKAVAIGRCVMTTPQQRLRDNLSKLPCGKTNWEIVRQHAHHATGQFTVADVMQSHEQSEEHYVIAALEWMEELGRVLETSDEGTRDNKLRTFRRRKSDG